MSLFPGIPNIGNTSDMHQKMEMHLQRIDVQIMEGLKRFEEFTTGTGVFDPNSIVPGLGLGANSFPTPPSHEVYRRYQKMQSDHGQEQQQFMTDLNEDVSFKKDLFFAENHFAIDENGKMLLGSDGRPIIQEGGETAEQRVARLRWERDYNKDLRARHKSQMDVYSDRRSDLSSEAFKDSSIFTDPEKSKAYWDKMNAIYEDCRKLELQQQREMMTGPYGFLPDPDRPGSTIGSFVNSGMNQYESMVERHKNIASNSPEGKQIALYGEQMKAFAEEQKRMMASYMAEMSEMADMAALRDLAKQQKPF